jgi:hypothetical protein
VSRSDGRRSLIRSFDHIAEPAQTLAPLIEDAADAGTRKSEGIEFVDLGKGFTAPTRTRPAAWRSTPTRAQMRAATRRAATLILRAEDELTEAAP